MYKSDRTPEQLTWIENFKFNFDVAQHSMLCVHATINATTHTMTTPPNRTGTTAEVAEMTRVIMAGIRDVI